MIYIFAHEIPNAHIHSSTDSYTVLYAGLTVLASIVVTTLVLMLVNVTRRDSSDDPDNNN